MCSAQISWMLLRSETCRLQEFQESFNCALRQKILLQGHLYIFTHHICFYSNIFGYLQKRVIPFKVGFYA